MLKTRFAILLTVIVAAATGATGQSSSLDYVALGDSLYAQFDNEGALEAYESAIDAGDTSLGLLLKRARTANDVAQDAEAAGHEQRARAMFDTAVGYAEHLRNAYPESGAAWFMLAATTGKLAQFQGGKQKVRTGRAVEEYVTKAIELDPNYAPSYLVAGIFRREVSQLNWVQRLAANALFGGVPSGTLEQSKELLRKAISLDRTLLIGHWELAQTCLAMNRPDEAIVHLRQTQILSPQNTEEVRIRERAAATLERNGWQ